MTLAVGKCFVVYVISYLSSCICVRATLTGRTNEHSLSSCFLHMA